MSGRVPLIFCGSRAQQDDVLEIAPVRPQTRLSTFRFYWYNNFFTSAKSKKNFFHISNVCFFFFKCTRRKCSYWGLLLKLKSKMAAPHSPCLHYIHLFWDGTVSLSLKTNNDTQHSLTHTHRHTHTPPCHPTRWFRENHNTHTQTPQWEPGNMPPKICVLGRSRIHNTHPDTPSPIHCL